MKKLLLILSIAFVGCSAEEIGPPAEDPNKPAFYVKLYEQCLGGDFDDVPVLEAEMNRVVKAWEDEGKPTCIYIEVDYYKPEPNTMSYHGYFKGHYGTK